MSDLIEREAAISYAISGAIRREDGEYWIRTKEVRQSLLNMPSAQPETHEKRTETHACDLISRQAAIDVIDKIFPADPMRNDYTQGITCGAALATEYIKQLPSAQPEEQKRCDTCRHEKDQWFLRCADCFDYELWEPKDEEERSDKRESDRS